MKNPLISIIVANYNGEKYLDICLKSIFASNYKNFELIVLDDGSTDKSLEVLNKYSSKKKLILILNKHNSGAASSRNKAVKFARGKILVFLDNDTEVKKNWLRELIKLLMRNKEIGACQSLLLDFKKRGVIQMGGGLLIPQTAWLAPFYQGRIYSKIKEDLREKEIVAVSASLAVKREVFKNVGGFDEKEAVYTEDLDFCWRIWISGYKILLCPKSVVYHWTKDVKKRKNMGVGYRQIYFHLAKNSIRSMLKNYQTLNLLKYLPLTLLINFGRGFLYIFSNRGLTAFSATIQAILWNVINASDTLKERKKVLGYRTLSDGELFKKIMFNKDLSFIWQTNKVSHRYR